MARFTSDNLHSRLVNVFKLVLPLLALALLSTLFIFSRTINPEDAIPYATVDVEDRLSNPKMTDAGFAGMTADGTAIAVTAAEATPTSEGGDLRKILGSLTTQTGARTEVSANTVHLNSDDRLLELRDGAELRSSDGYVVMAKGLSIALDQTNVTSEGEVTATGPMGNLNAKEMQLSKQPQTGAYLLVFKGRVSLIYQPPK